MLDLKDYIETLCNITGAHFSIVDTSGILNYKHFELPAKYRIHKTPFCEYAKQTKDGFDLCILEKAESNACALKDETICRICPHGIFKIVKPIKINSQIVCILHIGNLLMNSHSSSDYILAIDEFKSIPVIKNEDDYLKLADVIEEYINSLYEHYGKIKSDECYHWLSEALIVYINENYPKNISLIDFADKYKINAKYAGKIFNRDIGETFSSYLNSVRLYQAEKMLNGKKSITEVSLSVGFNSVSYFNKVFKEKHKISPSQYIKSYHLKHGE